MKYFGTITGLPAATAPAATAPAATAPAEERRRPDRQTRVILCLAGLAVVVILAYMFGRRR